MALRISRVSIWRLASQHRHDHADVFVHIGKLVRPETHTPATGVTRPEAGIDPARGQRVQRGQSIGRYGRNTVGGDQHAGGEPDPIGLHGGGTHRDEDVGAQHLRVIEPGGAEASILRALDGFPGIRGRGERDAEIHYLSSFWDFCPG